MSELIIYLLMTVLFIGMILVIYFAYKAIFLEMGGSL